MTRKSVLVAVVALCLALEVADSQAGPPEADKPTVIFVPADRFYPDGFRVEVGLGLVLALKPGDTQLCTVKFAAETSREQARLVHWDADSHHIVIKKWIGAAPGLTVRIAPMTEPATLPTRP